MKGKARKAETSIKPSLKDSELRYRSLFEAAKDGILILDTKTGTIEDVNPYLIKMLGYSREEFIKKKLWEVSAFKDIEASQDAFEALQENETIRYDNLPLKTKDGWLIQVEFVSSVYLAGSQKVIQCNIRDITEHKRAEDALQESEARYRRLFAAAQDGILILDARTGMIEDVNPYLIKMLGYSREEFIKKKIWEVGAFKDIEASKDAFGALQENEYIRYEDLPLKTKDGWLIQVEFVSNVYLVGDKKVIQCDIRDITEHKRIIAALQENGKKYHDLVNQSPDGMFIFGFSGAILTVNKAMIKELGFSAEEFLSTNIWELIPEQYLDQYRQSLTKILEGESLGEAGEYVVRGKDGKNHYVEILSAPYYSSKDVLIGFQGIARDVTAHKRAEEALLESEERFRKLVEHLPTVVYINPIGDSSFTLYVSPQIETLLGYTPQEWLSDPKLWSKTLHPEDRPQVLAQIAAADHAQNSEPFDMEYRVTARDGQIVWVHDHAALVNDLKGQPQYWQGIMLDITGRKEAEKTILRSENRYHTTLDNMMEGGQIIDYDWRYIYINNAAAKQWRKAPDELLMHTMMEAYPGIENTDLFHAMRLAMDDRVPQRIENQFFFSDGTFGWFELSMQPVPEGIFILSMDISERKLAEESVRISENKLRSLFPAMQDAIIVYDADGRYLEIAPTHPVNLYRPSNDMLGKTVTELFLPEQASFFLDHIRQTLKIGELTEAEYSLSFGEQTRWFLASISPLSSNSVIWVAHDITERKRSDERIQRQIEHLTALNEIDRIIASSFDLHMSLTFIVERIISQQKVDAADILIMNPDLNILEFGAGYGFRTLGIEKGHLALGEGYAGRAALERKTIHMADLRTQTANPLFKKALAGDNFVGYYAVPLIAKGKVKGVLEVFHRSPLDPDFEWLDFLNTLAGQAAIAIDNATLFGNLQHSNTELSLAYDATIEGWSRALDLRDKETEGHTQRVTKTTVALARTFGLREAELVQVRWGSLLHDIGKMGVPDGILLKPGPLTDEEWVTMRQHPTFAYKLLSPIGFLRSALDIPYCHHEKWDGSGYPRGLKEDQIPLVARIFAVIDVWDALTSDRVYRPAWTKEKAREHIRASSGTHFDPKVVDAFMQIPN